MKTHVWGTWFTDTRLHTALGGLASFATKAVPHRGDPRHGRTTDSPRSAAAGHARLAHSQRLSQDQGTLASARAHGRSDPEAGQAAVFAGRHELAERGAREAQSADQSGRSGSAPEEVGAASLVFGW